MFLFSFLSSCFSYPAPLSQSRCSPFTLFLSLSSLSFASCSYFLSSHLDPLIPFLTPSHLIVPRILLLCFFSCPVLVLLHAPLPFPLILFLLSCSSLPNISLFSLSCYPVSFLVFPLFVPVPLLFPPILFLLSCSFLPVISLFPLSCYSLRSVHVPCANPSVFPSSFCLLPVPLDVPHN